MTALNTQAQIIELTDDQLELVEGGRGPRNDWRWIYGTSYSYAPDHPEWHRWTA